MMNVVSCVAVSDEKGKSGSYLLQKEKIWAQMLRKVVSLEALMETVR